MAPANTIFSMEFMYDSSQHFFSLTSKIWLKNDIGTICCPASPIMGFLGQKHKKMSGELKPLKSEIFDSDCRTIVFKASTLRKSQREPTLLFLIQSFLFD